MSDEHALQSRHASPATDPHTIAHYLLHLPSEKLYFVFGRVFTFRLFVAIKVREERSGLLGNGIVDEGCQVDTARPYKCRIESFNVVRGEEYDPLFARGDTVQSIQESREGHGGLIPASIISLRSPDTYEWNEVPGAHLPVFTCLHALVKRRVDVFDKNKTPFGRVRHQVVELVVGQATFGKVQQAYIIRQRPSQSLNERRLSRSRWSMEQISSAIRNTLKKKTQCRT